MAIRYNYYRNSNILFYYYLLNLVMKGIVLALSLFLVAIVE
ncbi:hypothetical protein ATN83_4173 [Raoultella ornithinolytica]|nr:hypothetical protein ATN83_4173 [Raoultella ornithinolytica]KDV95065.1 putative membrane protein [Raoultella ornithinolytica 2-156-04_S1_C1]KDX15903.1 putative membrane protein [Raoultella ornithinolytica 2-156-04_S1_C2]